MSRARREIGLDPEEYATPVNTITTWNQVYDPVWECPWLSTLAASLPVIALLGMIASGKVKAHIAAVLSLVLAFCVAVFLFGMPA